MTTNPLITEARKLFEDRRKPTFSVNDFTSRSFTLETARFIAFAANNLLAFADKIEEQEKEIAQLRAALTERLKEIEENSRKEEEFGLKYDAMESQVATLTQQNADLKAACESPMHHFCKTFCRPLEEAGHVSGCIELRKALEGK